MSATESHMSPTGNDMTSSLERDALGRTFTTQDPTLAQNPYPVYQVLRDGPLLRSELYGGYWIFARYEDVLLAYERPDLFSSYPASIPSLAAPRPLIPTEIDPPDHLKYRQILAPIFAPPRVRELEDAVRRDVRDLIGRFASRGSCEFISELAGPLPTQVFLSLMGWPMSDTPQFHQWAETINRGVPGDPAEDARVRTEAGGALFGYFAKVVEEKRQHPGDDVVSTLLQSRFGDERPLTVEEILDIIFILLLAGLDTTTSALGHAFLHLAGRRDLRQKVARDPEAIPVLVEEFLRFDSPISPARQVTQDIEIRGTKLQAGDMVLLLPGSASRDEREFPEADELVADRHPNRHLAFGAGPHRCVGSHLARMELRVVLEEFHKVIPDYEVDPDGSIEQHLGNVKGVDRLPLKFPSAGGA